MNRKITLSAKLLLLIVLLASGALAAAQQTKQSMIVGVVRHIHVDDPANDNDIYPAGTITVGAHTVIVPRNLLVDLPANRMTLWQFVNQASVPGKLAEGNTMATILANRQPDGRIIAGDVFIAKGLAPAPAAPPPIGETLTGIVSFINFTDGYFRLEGTTGQDSGGTVVRINDPTGRHTIQQGLGCVPNNTTNCSADDRFGVDPVNYTATFATGYPVCIPSTVVGGGRTIASNATGVGDPFCPATNRGVSPVADSTRFAPIQVGDHLTAIGNFDRVAGVTFFSAYNIEVSAKLITKQDANSPDYMIFKEVEWDTPGFVFSRIRMFAIGGMTNPDRNLDIFSLHTGQDNKVHEFPLATTVNNPDALLGVPDGQIFRVRYDIDFLRPPAPRLSRSMCVDLTQAGFNVCPQGGTLEEEVRIASPISREIIGRTRHKAQLNPGVVTRDIRGQVAPNGEYLTPVGINYPEMAEVDLGALNNPFNFEGVPWLLDRRVGPGGCNGNCEQQQQPLCPFPLSGLDPRNQSAVALPASVLNKPISFFPFGPPNGNGVLGTLQLPPFTGDACTVTAPAGPASPTNLQASVTGNSVLLTWTASTSSTVTQYGIYRDGASSPLATVSGTTFTFTDLNVAAGPHTYAVDAADGSIRSAKTPAVSVNIGDTTPPSVPLNFTATLNGTNAQLAWSASTDLVGVTGYGVYRNNVKINDVTGAPPVTSFTDSNLVPGTYTYKVDAIDAAGNRSAASNTSTVTIAALPVATAPVQSLTATTLGATTANVTLSWSGTGAIHHYQLQRSTNGGTFADVSLPALLSTSLTPSLALNTRFQFRVRAVNSSGAAGAFATGPSFTVATNDNNSAAITYTASWATTTLTGAFGGSVRATSTANARATFTTTTIANGVIAWVSSRGPDRGIATISIDGGAAVTVNLFATSAQRSAVVFRSAALSAGTHTVRVTALGTKDSRSSGRRVDVDAFLSIR